MKKSSRKNYIKIFFSLVGFLFLSPIKTEAQKIRPKSSNALLAEKIYLQLDRNVYTNGDTVWFKCVVSNASELTPSLLSGVLYVELIGTDQTMLQKKLIKIENGIGQGNFDLDKNIPKGNYLIRAYTQWNQNFDNDFIFKEYIQVFTKDIDPFQNIKLIKEKTVNDHLEVQFNPQVIDSLQKNRLIVFINIDDLKDTLVIKKETNKYSLDYDIKKGSQFATLKIQTENAKTYTKRLALNKDYLDLQFFPESGELVQGLTSKVGFKSLDANGKGKLIEGDIVDEKENVITSFKSNTLGMGIFFIRNADSTKKYYARVNTKTLKYPLPKVVARGTVLSINKQSDKLLINTLSNYIEKDSLLLNISFRGIDLFEKKISLNQGASSTFIATDSIPEGIIAFTLLDNTKKPIAERLYFNEKTQSRIKIKIAADKNKYSKRELTNLAIETTNSKEEPIKTNTSVLVIRKEELGIMQSLRQNILSCFLIDSELKGNIENPGYYFNNNNNNNNNNKYYDLEALMLTQGWSKYNYSKNYQPITIAPEKTLTVSGKVNSLFSEKKAKKDINLTMMTYGKDKSIYTQQTDSLGKFNFNLKDEYGSTIKLLFQTTKNTEKKTNNPVVLDEKKSPSVSFEQHTSIGQIDSIVEPFIKRSRIQKEMDEKLDMQFGSILLDEVNIANNSNPNRKKVTEKYGKPKTIISGKEIQAKEQKWSYGLYSVLLFNFPDKVYIRQTENNFLEAIVHNMPTVILIDGIAVPYVSYQYIPDISPSEVTSIEIIEYPNDFINLYCGVHSEIQNCIINPELIYGHIIAIYTRAGIGLSGAYKPKGLTQTTIPVFASPKEFYAPKYDNIQPDDWKHPDIRTLIHWQPILNTDRSGKATTSFYNTDSKGKNTVIVEAISDTGEIGYQEFDYEISD